MSLICESKSELEGYIRDGNNKEIVRCLEVLVRQKMATDAQTLLLGVLLLLPPFADYDDGVGIFNDLLTGPKALAAATWSAYGYGVLQPSGTRNFEPILKLYSGSAVARHMLGLIAHADDDQEKYLSESRASRKIEVFPFNILSALDGDPDLEVNERHYLRSVFVDLLVSRSAEADSPVCTVEGLLGRKWDNLISGVRITSQYWSLLTESW